MSKKSNKSNKSNIVIAAAAAPEIAIANSKVSADNCVALLLNINCNRSFKYSHKPMREEVRADKKTKAIDLTIQLFRNEKNEVADFIGNFNTLLNEFHSKLSKVALKVKIDGMMIVKTAKMDAAIALINEYNVKLKDIATAAVSDLVTGMNSKYIIADKARMGGAFNEAIYGQAIESLRATSMRVTRFSLSPALFGESEYTGIIQQANNERWNRLLNVTKALVESITGFEKGTASRFRSNVITNLIDEVETLKDIAPTDDNVLDGIMDKLATYAKGIDAEKIREDKAVATQTATDLENLFSELDTLAKGIV